MYVRREGKDPIAVSVSSRRFAPAQTFSRQELSAVLLRLHASKRAAPMQQRSILCHQLRLKACDQDDVGRDLKACFRYSVSK